MNLRRLGKHLGTGHDQQTHNPNHHHINGIDFEDTGGEFQGGKAPMRYRLLETFGPGTESSKQYSSRIEWATAKMKQLQAAGVTRSGSYGDRQGFSYIFFGSKPKEADKAKEAVAHRVVNGVGLGANTVGVEGYKFMLDETISADDPGRYDWLEEKGRWLMSRGVRHGSIRTTYFKDKDGQTRYGVFFNNIPKEAQEVSGGGIKTKFVSEFIGLTPTIAKSVDSAFGAIDRVLEPEYIKPIPFRQTSGTKTVGGFLASRTGEPIEITISPGTKHREMTVWHELGHALDGELARKLKSKGSKSRNTFASEMTDVAPVQRVMAAIRESKHIRGMKSFSGLEFVKKIPGLSVSEVIDRSRDADQRVAYLSSSVECFARAFAQYIGTRGGPQARAFFEKEKKEETERKGTFVYNFPQWPDDEFEPIAQAMDELFDYVGWRK